MHSILRCIYDKSLDYFKTDDRVLAAYMLGSALSEREDEFSDVDPVFFIKADCYQQFDKELPDFFRSMCDEIVLWWPERFNNETWKNYAVIFLSRSVLLQYDITIEPVPEENKRTILPEQLIFDKTGSIFTITDKIYLPKPSHDEINRTIDTYLVWSYIQAKYVRRKDIPKLIYVQQELFNSHLKVISYIYDHLRSYGWWCHTIKAIKDSYIKDILISYLSHHDLDSISGKIIKQVLAFEKDSRDCCQKFNLPYPADKQQKVFRHLKESIS